MNTEDLVTVPSANGHPVNRVRATQKASAKAAARARGGRGELTPLQRVSLVVGGTGATALGLSVIHCSQSIQKLTGSHWALASMLAITVDIGMVACEVAEVVTHDSKAAKSVGPWARRYIVLAVVLSMILNALGSAANAAPGMVYGSYLLGAIIPILVYILGRTAGLLWTAKP